MLSWKTISTSYPATKRERMHKSQVNPWVFLALFLLILSSHFFVTISLSEAGWVSASSEVNVSPNPVILGMIIQLVLL